MKKAIFLLSFALSVLLLACGTTKTAGGKRSGAKKEKTVELTPELCRKFDYFFLEAVRQKQKGEYDAAYELYQHCLELNPSSAAVLYELSQFYMFLGQEEKGEQALKQAVRAEESNFWYKQTLASYYENKRDYPKAISAYEDMAEQFPDRLEPLISLSELYGVTKNYQKVIDTLNRLEELDGKSEQISMEKFKMYFQMGEKNKAFAEIENLSKEYPYDLRYQTILGDVYLNNNAPQEAYDTYQRILKENPNYAPALLSMATYYQKMGNDSLYRMQLDTILVNDDVLSDTKMEIMRQMIIQSEQTDKDSTQIVSQFHRILQRPQQNADLAMLCAQYCVTKRMNADAKPALEQVLVLDPENKPARLQLLSYAVTDRNNDEIIRVSRSALEFMPDALEFYYYMGVAYYQKEDSDKALDVFSRGVKQVNDSTDTRVVSDLYSLMGDIYHTKGKNALAYAAYDSSLVYNPDNINSLNNYAYFLSVDRIELDKAEEMSYRTVKADPDNGTYLDTYAWILFEKGKYTEARIYIEQALRNDGDKSRTILEHAGDIYSLIGDTEKALDYWKKADAIDLKEGEGGTPPSVQDIQRLKKKIKLKKYISK